MKKRIFQLHIGFQRKVSNFEKDGLIAFNIASV